MGKRKNRKYRVFFTIKGVVEVEAKSKQEAEDYVAQDPLGVTKGDYDLDFTVEEDK